MVIIVIAVTLILLLFLPINIIFLKDSKEKKFYIWGIKIPSIKTKGIGLKRLNNNIAPIHKGVNYLINYTSVNLVEFTPVSVFDLAEKPISSITKIISTSSLLAYFSYNCKNFVFSYKRYIVTEVEANKSKIKIKATFLLFRLIISLFIVAYYKLRYV